MASATHSRGLPPAPSPGRARTRRVLAGLCAAIALAACDDGRKPARGPDPVNFPGEKQLRYGISYLYDTGVQAWAYEFLETGAYGTAQYVDQNLNDARIQQNQADAQNIWDNRCNVNPLIPSTAGRIDNPLPSGYDVLDIRTGPNHSFAPVEALVATNPPPANQTHVYVVRSVIRISAGGYPTVAGGFEFKTGGSGSALVLAAATINRRDVPTTILAHELGHTLITSQIHNPNNGNLMYTGVSAGTNGGRTLEDWQCNEARASRFVVDALP